MGNWFNKIGVGLCGFANMFKMSGGSDKNAIDRFVHVERVSAETNKYIQKNSGFKLDRLYYQQNKGFLGAQLTGEMDNFGRMHNYPLNSEIIANGYCFNKNQYIDDTKPCWLGTTDLGAEVAIDFFKKTSKRINYNTVIMGTSGSGKSFLTTKILNQHIILNRRVVIIDPENDYGKICRKYGGNLISVANPKLARINPLQVFASFDADEENNPHVDYAKMSVQALENHILFVRDFLKILLTDYEIDGSAKYNMNQTQKVFIDQGLKRVYDIKQIDNSNYLSKMPHEFPTFSDLHDVLKKQLLTGKHFDAHPLDESDRKALRTLLQVLAGMLVDQGTYARFFDGYTTLTIDNNLTVFNFYGASEEKAFKFAQIYLILQWLNNYVQLNDQANDNEIVIAIDEAHTLIDKNNFLALVFIAQMAKRIRKKKGGIILITQNPEDFLESDDLIKHTKTAINNSQYLFVFKMEDANIARLQSEIFNNSLNQSELNFIVRALNGNCFMKIAQDEKIFLNVRMTPWDQEVAEYHGNEPRN